jgi:hypothetical protein
LGESEIEKPVHKQTVLVMKKCLKYVYASTSRVFISVVFALNGGTPENEQPNPHCAFAYPFSAISTLPELSKACIVVFLCCYPLSTHAAPVCT